ncbi:MAG: hypothetical protein QXW74_01465 [Archaeoglobaceae archaeon]
MKYCFSKRMRIFGFENRKRFYLKEFDVKIVENMLSWKDTSKTAFDIITSRKKMSFY